MSVHPPPEHDRDTWQLAIWNADDAVLTRPQKLALMQMVEVRYNLYDPFVVVGDLLRHRDLWRSVLMCRGFPTDAHRPGMPYLHGDLIPLRDLPQGHWNVDTVYLLHDDTRTDDLTRLAGGWRADEVDAVAGDEAGCLLGCFGAAGVAILRVWWD